MNGTIDGENERFSGEKSEQQQQQKAKKKLSDWKTTQTKHKTGSLIENESNAVYHSATVNEI